MMGPIPQWSRDKLELLAKYLQAYSTIMQSQKRSGWLRAYSFVDSFAGAGQYIDPDAREDRDSQEYIDGSPLVALQCDPPFDVCWFIDLRPARVESLRRLVETYPGRDVRLRSGDANAILVEDIARTITYEKFERGLVFLDPYGLQVRWSTVEALAATRALDLVVNFPIMAVNRQLPRDAIPDAATLDRLGHVMRDQRWAEGLYVTQGAFFRDPRSTRPGLPAEQLARIYTDDVKTLFRHVSRPVVMRNSVNAPLYALFLASHNETAARITNDIFNKHEGL